ncbi:MAG TPA: PIN domain-containing protein [Rudaea sp.]
MPAAGGKAGRWRSAWQARRIVPLTSRETADELIRVLAYPKFKLTTGEQHDLLADELPFCEAARIAQPPATPHCRDPNDVPFLQLALAAKAACDRHGRSGSAHPRSAAAHRAADAAQAIGRLSSAL